MCRIHIEIKYNHHKIRDLQFVSFVYPFKDIEYMPS